MDLAQLDKVKGAKLLESSIFFTTHLSGARTISGLERELQDAAGRCEIAPEVLNAALTELVKLDRGAEEAARFLLSVGMVAGLEEDVDAAVAGAGKKQGGVENGLISTAIVAGLVLVLERLNARKTVIEIDKDGNVRIEMEGIQGSYLLGEELVSLLRQVLGASAHPAEAQGRKADLGQKDNEAVAAMLRRLERIALSECVVVGKYLRYDPKIRNTLKDWVRRIETPLLTKTTALENYLIWAAPGSGKTYLIQQIAEELKHKLDSPLIYIECNLAKDDRDEFTDKVNSLLSQTQPVLCLLDEIDARPSDKWPYDVCFPKLDLNLNPGKRVVVVLIGSTHSSVKSMVEAMRGRHKGPDLLSRILLDLNCLEIPGTTLEDSATMVVGQSVALLEKKVRAVEKLALFYILCNDTLRGSPRQLSEFMKAAATRYREGDERLRFHHLFHPADDKQYEFQRANEQLLDEFKNVDVQVS